MANMTLVKDNGINVIDKFSERLGKEVKAIADAYGQENKAKWKKAEACYNVINGEYWKDNDSFESQEAFAKYVGVSPSQLSGYLSAVKFILAHEDLVKRSESTGEILTGSIFMSKAEILGRLENYEEVNRWCVDNYKAPLVEFGDNSIKKIVKAFKNTLIEDKAQTEDKAEDKAEAQAEAQTEAQAEKTEYVRIIYGATKQEAICEALPISILNQIGQLIHDYITETIVPPTEAQAEAQAE